jgi:cardiolipin synthase A/B
VRELSNVGIKTWRYSKGFLHHKIVVADDLCTIGTANFDNRSFRLNFEITMEFADRAFTDKVIAMMTEDFGNARPVEDTELQQQGFWFRFATAAARLTAPVQ